MARIYAVNVQVGAGQGLSFAELQQIKSMGFNTVRLPLYWGVLMPTDEYTVNGLVFTDTLGPANTYGMDTYVDWCGQLGLNIIFVMAWTETWSPPAWAFPGLVSDYDKYELMFTYGSREGTAYVNAWKAVAGRYDMQPHVMMELVNEPGINSAFSNYPTLYKQFIEDIIAQMQLVEKVNHVKIVPMLRADVAWEEVVDQQPDIDKPNVAWSTHRYEPYGPYDPNAPAYCYNYETGEWGLFTMEMLVYWRIRRCSDKIREWGKEEINTEFGKGTNSTNWDLWLNQVLDWDDEMGLAGWTFNTYDKAPDDMSVVDPAGTPVTAILNILQSHMLPVATYTLQLNSVPSGVTIAVDGIPYAAPSSVTLTEGLHIIGAPSNAVINEASYSFAYWEDTSTNPNRQIYLTGDRSITATYNVTAITAIETHAFLDGNPVVANGTIIETAQTFQILEAGTIVEVPAGRYTVNVDYGSFPTQTFDTGDIASGQTVRIDAQFATPTSPIPPEILAAGVAAAAIFAYIISRKRK